MSDLTISGSACSIPCFCSRWSSDNYSFIVETWLTKSQWLDLRDSIRPGAVGILYTILGRPFFADKTWQGLNTLTFTPIAGNQLFKMRKATTGYCRNVTSSPLEGEQGNIWVKVECFVSGNQSL